MNNLNQWVGRTFALVTVPPRFSRMEWDTNGSYRLVANPHRTAGNELMAHEVADADKRKVVVPPDAGKTKSR